jgi:hypothetical protein
MRLRRRLLKKSVLFQHPPGATLHCQFTVPVARNVLLLLLVMPFPLPIEHSVAAASVESPDSTAE